ncbi:MAG: LPS export ABC transporter periplasmic protein LptC [Candidatus Gorgyraea atricola]|nr:LPS export ABC transporter periplasmic protein LptC [Candidatus Gorgyraea atricola]
MSAGKLKKIVIGSALVLVAGFSFAQDADQEVDGFSLVQYEDGGTKQWKLSGKSAEVKDNEIKIDEVSALSYGKEAALKLKAKQGTFDREKNLVTLQDDVVAKSTDGTTITCDGPLEINYNKNRAAFLNNVKVKDSKGDIFADRIDVYFNDDTRRVRCVVARGNVRIVSGENITYSEKAIYLVNQGRVILPKRSKLVIKSEIPR